MEKNNTVLVIGGSGFVGEHIVQVLHARGFVVEAPAHSELQLHDMAALATHVAQNDTIVMLTQPSGEGMAALVSVLARSTPKHILYASTALLYGTSMEPQREDAPLYPLSDYERAKYAEEEMLRAAPGGHIITIARLSNVYGGTKNRGIVGLALKAMYGGDPLVVAGESQVRDFIYVCDVAKAIVHLATQVPGGVVNVTTGRGVTIGELLTMLERIAGRGIPRVRGSEGLEKHVVGDNTTLRASGFMPATTLEEGLAKTHAIYARSIRQ